jgi:hypothetical protein
MGEGSLPRYVRPAIAFLLLAVSILFLLSGFGITNAGIVGPLTLGILDKPLAFRLHGVLWAPFAALLAAHLLLPLLYRQQGNKR